MAFPACRGVENPFFVRFCGGNWGCFKISVFETGFLDILTPGF
jgi:hypothetical protein